MFDKFEQGGMKVERVGSPHSRLLFTPLASLKIIHCRFGREAEISFLSSRIQPQLVEGRANDNISLMNSRTEEQRNSRVCQDYTFALRKFEFDRSVQLSMEGNAKYCESSSFLNPRKE